ncbi:dynamin family protein [Pseudonocardia sp. DSM 110487]|uniref:dynamin family protein n=1 Tax=Pseudonocardia sp. DSM 110487 TaxID=2865833 RepID=UPI001C6983B8|nr:dynamin family protein [Pseudonocardia sp. DSM 110487]QYN38298.1 dynamin family protein [Pseudonocardia sp. DSM 110487]
MPNVPGPLAGAVVALAARAERSVDQRLADVGHRCLERLRAPLSIALVGRVSSGKSTLLNALMGSRVAPTNARECTKIVYKFRYGPRPTATLVLRTGSGRIAVDLDDSRLPADFGRPASEISHIDVTMPLPLLQEAVLIDTPGLASAQTENAAATERMLHDTGDYAARADVILFCINGPITQDEADAVHTFARGSGGNRLNGATAVGILTKADQLSGNPLTSWKAATEIARNTAAGHADLFWTVVPVVGLLAETARTGALRDVHARALGALAQAWNRDVAHAVLRHKKMFLGAEGPVDTPVRAELLDLLGRFGVGELLDQIRSGTRPDVASLSRESAVASGMAAVSSEIHGCLAGRSDALKAAGALDELVPAAYYAGDRALYEDANSMLDWPQMFPVKVIGMGQQLATGRVRPPAGLVDEAWRAVRTGLPGATSGEAARAAGEWKRWALLTDGAGRRMADVMVRAWQLAAEEGRR